MAGLTETRVVHPSIFNEVLEENGRNLTKLRSILECLSDIRNRTLGSKPEKPIPQDGATSANGRIFALKDQINDFARMLDELHAVVDQLNTL